MKGDKKEKERERNTRRVNRDLPRTAKKMENERIRKEEGGRKREVMRRRGNREELKNKT